MAISKYQSQKRFKTAQEAFELYKKGMSLRQVARVVNKSHQWVNDAVKEIEKLSVDKVVDKSLQ